MPLPPAPSGRGCFHEVQRLTRTGEGNERKRSTRASCRALQTPQAQQQTEVVVDDSGTLPSYSNFCRVTATPEEVILDFGLNPQPFATGRQDVKANQRIVMNFYTAKRLLTALGMTIQRHEGTFGSIELDVRRRAPARAPGLYRSRPRRPPGRCRIDFRSLSPTGRGPARKGLFACPATITRMARSSHSFRTAPSRVLDEPWNIVLTTSHDEFSRSGRLHRSGDLPPRLVFMSRFSTATATMPMRSICLGWCAISRVESALAAELIGRRCALRPGAARFTTRRWPKPIVRSASSTDAVGSGRDAIDSGSTTRPFTTTWGWRCTFWAAMPRRPRHSGLSSLRGPTTR